MRDVLFDPFGERLDLPAKAMPGQEMPAHDGTSGTRAGRGPATPRSRRRLAGTALFWLAAAGLIVARGVYFDPGTAFGPDRPEQLAAAQTEAVIRQADLRRHADAGLLGLIDRRAAATAMPPR